MNKQENTESFSGNSGEMPEADKACEQTMQPGVETNAGAASQGGNERESGSLTVASTVSAVSENINACAEVAVAADSGEDSVSDSFDPVLLSDGKPCDLMGVGAGSYDVSGNSFVIDKASAVIRVKLTVDDRGTLILRHQESGQEFSFSAVLPEGEWTKLDDADYWQTDEECDVPKGHYTVTGSVTNTGTAHSQNRAMLRYEVYLVAGEDTVDPIPPDEPEEEISVCCACGGCEEKDGNGNVIATVDLPGESFMDKCFLKSQFEALQQQTAAVSETDEESSATSTVSGGLKFTGAWSWKASYDAAAGTVSVTPPTGPALNFAVAEGSSVAVLTGSSRKYRYDMQLSDAEGNPVTSGSPSVLKLVAADGTQVRFDAESGEVLSIRTADGRLVNAADFRDNVAVVTDDNDLIQSVYSATDGLMKASVQIDGSTLYAWYAPAQVTVAEGEYRTSGEPFRTENYLTTVVDGVKTTVITRQQTGLPAHAVTRVENGGTTTITKGCGEEAVNRTITRSYLGNNVMETIESLSRASDAAPAACTRKLELRTDGGWVLLENTEGYGSDIAQTTAYEYDSLFRVSRINYHNGAYTRYGYDSEGREVLAAEPWAGGIEKITHTTYSDARFFDNRPASVAEYRVTGSGSEVLFRTTAYTYEDSAEEEKVTVTVTAGGSTQQQVSISSRYGESAAYSYAAGKTKFEQDVNGMQTRHEYGATSEYGAVHKHTVITEAAGESVAAHSRMKEEFIAADDTVTFERESVWDGTQWLLLSTTAYEYDAQHRVVKNTRGNGLASTTDWMCCGILRHVDEDGIVTTNAYNSAHELTETSRSEVYDGEVCVTPETITEYTRDAAGRILCTTRRIGAMETSEFTEYDALGRVVRQVDVLGRATVTAYSADGLTVTVTNPAGATFVTVENTDGSTAQISGTGQRSQQYVYDMSGYCERTTTESADGSIIAQSMVNGFGQTVAEARPNTLNGFIYTRSEFNEKGLLVKTYQDTGWNTAQTAATLYEYDAFGNQVKQTLALSDTPTKDNSPVVETSYAVESAGDGVYTAVSQTRYNAEGNALSSTQKRLISELSVTLSQKSISIDERGLTSSTYTVYNDGTKRTEYSIVPTSDITAEVVTVDGFALSQKDTAGITVTAGRSYTASGMVFTQTDGRGNSTTTVTDIAGRTIRVTDAAGNSTETEYAAVFDLPATVTDAQGNTACRKYDVRGRKIAEWGTGIQPACFGYDDADRMVSLTTFRAAESDITTDPSELTGGDTTTWTFDEATGLELSKTYADNSSVSKVYDSFNRFATETDARGNIKTRSYENARGLLTGITYSDDTSSCTFSYNHLGQLTQVTDSAGTRSIGYNTYGEQETDSLIADDVTHLITETRDAYGRSSGFTYTKDGTVQHTVTTGYGTDGRIATAGFLHGGSEKQFGYTYLSGSNLLQTLTMPCNMTLTQSYEAQRDLLTGMVYKRGSTGVVERGYTYDTLGRPTARNTARNSTTVNDSFGYNTRSELISATVSSNDYAYSYDNIGNRTTAQEAAETATAYSANNLNQYTVVGDFAPTYDTDGNQTLVKTSTGIWTVEYNAENRPIRFTSSDGSTVIECSYDYMGRRATKKVTENGSITLHHRYLYRGYLQIACCDLTRSGHPCLWLLTWDPTQPVATRPLAIRKDGSWFAYGWDLTKNICEVFGPAGYIRTSYTYSPYGSVSASGDVTQPIQWSSEYYDTETALVYYNYRHYNPSDGRWLGRDPEEEKMGLSLTVFTYNNPVLNIDLLGLATEITDIPEIMDKKGFHTAARAMRKWLGVGVENGHTPMYVEMSWVIQYDDYRKKYEELKEKATSPAAMRVLRSRISNLNPGDSFPEPFLRMTIELHKKYHIQTIGVTYWPPFNSDNFTDQYATLGRFAFHALAYGYVYIDGKQKKKACITHIGYYAKDNYSFEDKGQSLGYWDKEENSVKWWSLFGKGRSFKNDDFIEYKKIQNNKNKGVNFDIFTNIVKEPLHPVKSIEL